MSNLNPALLAKLQEQLVTAIVLQVLHHADDPALISEVISGKADPARLHDLLSNHNELRFERRSWRRPAIPRAHGSTSVTHTYRIPSPTLQNKQHALPIH